MKRLIQLKSTYMTLGQLLKHIDVISSGGQAKWFLQNNDVLVNGQSENRRGRKLYAGDQVELPNNEIWHLSSTAENS
ncbi:MAG: S4 domain-containing protein YaaA [Liquorilactobacillus ghanensis]|nr:S4 domain-containing protein YaaA [Liquorilactobacillus ghanensis]